jgi:pyruvate,water dikinase
MLGFHGVRYSILNPGILKAELKGLKRVAKKGKKVGLLLPQVILVDEVKKVKEMLKEIDFLEAKVGVMVETPAAVQIIEDLCKEGIDFISFGTNDLTQYMLAIDRGNGKVQHLYDEMHPAILYQLAYVIRVCKRYGIETSICGQSGSRKEMAKYLVEKGIDSISVNADVAKEISDYVYEIEKGLIEGTDKEPRQYEKEKIKEKINQDEKGEEISTKKAIEALEEEKENSVKNKSSKEEEEVPGLTNSNQNKDDDSLDIF